MYLYLFTNKKVNKCFFANVSITNQICIPISLNVLFFFIFDSSEMNWRSDNLKSGYLNIKCNYVQNGGRNFRNKYSMVLVGEIWELIGKEKPLFCYISPLRKWTNFDRKLSFRLSQVNNSINGRFPQGYYDNAESFHIFFLKGPTVQRPFRISNMSVFTRQNTSGGLQIPFER